MRELLKEAAEILGDCYYNGKEPLLDGTRAMIAKTIKRITAALAEPERGGIDKTTVSLCLPKADDPFYRAECKVIDIGYADNRLVVECPELQKPGAAPEPDAMDVAMQIYYDCFLMGNGKFEAEKAAALIADFGRVGIKQALDSMARCERETTKHGVKLEG